MHGRKVPTILVRALPISIGETHEAQVRESYSNLGVDEFFNLYDAAEREGIEAALQRFREFVSRQIPRMDESSAAKGAGVGHTGEVA
jgi:hypothetical protein